MNTRLRLPLLGLVLLFQSAGLPAYGHSLRSAGPAVERAAAAPPEQPTSGYGSSERYISDTYDEVEFGSGRDGSRVWYYVPDVLKNGTSAPVVVFLHGWTAYVPDGYLWQIEHLVKQGYIVVFPQYQKGGVIGIMTDLDQNRFLERAMTGVDEALSRIGELAELDEVLVTGHSLGGLLSLCWTGAGGVRPHQIVFQNGEFNSSDEIPESVPIVSIDWHLYSDAVTMPVIFLTGDRDQYNAESTEVRDALPVETSAHVYVATTDVYGSPDIVANHVAPMNDGTVVTLDYRFYLATLDAALDHQTSMSYDLGAWSDGTPVKSVVER